MAETIYDVAVIGSGPGGYVAAIRAAQLGLSVAVIERDQLGGVCLNWGCIPTKALLRSAEIFHLARHLDAFGLAADNVRFDAAKIVKRSRDVAARLNGGVKHLLKKNKVTVIEGVAAALLVPRVALVGVERAMQLDFDASRLVGYPPIVASHAIQRIR